MAAEQQTEITTTAIDLEFLPTDTNEGRGVQNLEFVLQQMHTALMALASCEAIERWESHVSRHEKKMKDKLDDEIKLADLEATGARGA